MDLIKISIKRPTAVIAIGLMFVVFGFVAVKNIPIQMAPDVDRPILQITSWWPGTSPLEVEREVSNRIEENVVEIIEKDGVPEGVDITMSGASDKLTETWDLSSSAG